jgi:hypothetical protein
MYLIPSWSIVSQMAPQSPLELTLMHRSNRNNVRVAVMRAYERNLYLGPTICECDRQLLLGLAMCAICMRDACYE